MNTRRPDGSQPATSPTGTRQGTRPRAIAGLASLVDEVVARLEEPVGADLAGKLIPGCNAALEGCLELLRDPGDRDNLVRTARDDLKRLARLMKLVDGPDLAFVLRQIRRVLGRFDACGGGLVVEWDS